MAEATLFGVDFDAADFLNGGHLDPVTINGQSLQRFIAALYAVSLEANAMKGVGALSTTSLAIGTGSKAFTFTPTSQAWDVGQIVRAASLADPTDYMVGAVTATGTGTVTLDVTVTGGSGTHADWFLSTPAPGLSLPLAVSQGGTGGATAAAARSALGVGNHDQITVSADGEMTLPGQPAFLAYLSADQADETGNARVAPVDFDTEVFDRGGDFASGVFTAPVTGLYRLDATVTLKDWSSTVSQVIARVVTSNRSYDAIAASGFPTTNVAHCFRVSVLADMDAADTALVQIIASGLAGDTLDINGAGSPYRTYFSGSLIA